MLVTLASASEFSLKTAGKRQILACLREGIKVFKLAFSRNGIRVLELACLRAGYELCIRGKSSFTQDRYDDAF